MCVHTAFRKSCVVMGYGVVLGTCVVLGACIVVGGGVVLGAGGPAGAQSHSHTCALRALQGRTPRCARKHSPNMPSHAHMPLYPNAEVSPSEADRAVPSAPCRAHAHLGVGDDEQALGVVCEMFLEPHTRLEVEVVRRLIEQQQLQ